MHLRLKRRSEGWLDLVRHPPDRNWAIAVRQMARDEAAARLLVGMIRPEPFSRDPAGEVRDAAQVDAPGVCGVAPVAQVGTVRCHMRPEYALHQRGARRRRHHVVVHVYLPRARTARGRR